MDISKGFRMRVWHRKFHRIFIVGGILGLNTSECKIRTSESSVNWDDCEKMLYIGEKDKDNIPIFQDDILSCVIKGVGGKKTIIEGRVTYKDCAFKLIAEVEDTDNVGHKVQKEFTKIEWNESKVVGNIYNPPRKSWDKK